MLLAGCSSFSDANGSNSKQVLSGGERVGHDVHLFWVTQNKQTVTQAADYVVTGDGHGYKTTYQWTDGVVREVARQGESLKNGEVVPFETLLRFDAHGDAIYQRYRVDGKVFPLSQQQTEQYQQQARDVLKVTTDEHKQGLELIQGYWNGQAFETCNGQQFASLTFNHTVADAIVERLESSKSYIAFVGQRSGDTVKMKTMLMLKESNHGCVTPKNEVDD